MNNIFYKQRSVAEVRAKQHMLKVERPHQYAFVEIDPMPELPLDHVIYGNPAHLKIPTSHYK